MSKSLPKWTDERTNTLIGIVGAEDPVTQETVKEAAETLETTPLSVAAKLRKLGYNVESVSATRTKSFTDEQEATIRSVLESEPNKHTPADLSVILFGNEEKAKQVQGKVLSMDLSHLLMRVPPKVVVKKFTDEETDKIAELINSGAYLEDIAEAMGRDIKQIRGKALAMQRSHGTAFPPQRDKKTKTPVDPFDGLDVASLTVEELAKELEKTERGIKTMLTYRELTAKDYDGAAKAKKNAEKRAAAAS